MDTLLAGQVNPVLNKREDYLKGAAAVIAAMSDEELMEGTDRGDSYHQEFHPCPRSCEDQVPQNWTVYTDIGRLTLCKEPLLFDFNIYTPVTDPQSLTTKLRVCNAGDSAASKPGLVMTNQTTPAITTRTAREPRTANPAPACAANVTETKVTLQLAKLGSGARKGDAIDRTLDQLEHYYAAAVCDSTLMFSSAGGVLAGIHVGSGIGRGTVSSAIKSLLGSIEAGGSADVIIAQLCGLGRSKNNTFGVAISTTGNLTAVQDAVKAWNEGGCVTVLDATDKLPDTTIWEAPFDLVSLTNGTSTNSTVGDFVRRGVSRFLNGGRAELARRGLCTTKTVVTGDSCGALAKKCGISAADFTKYNPDSELCSTLQPGNLVCCTAGGMDDLIPKKGADGICATYTVAAGDNCQSIAGKRAIKAADIEKYNKMTTWGWYGCERLMQDMNICLSDGK